jgi:hypothetical protein
MLVQGVPTPAILALPDPPPDNLQQTACKLGYPFLYIGAEVLIAWILFDRSA